VTEWVKLRVRSLNYVDVPSAWVNAASLFELTPWALPGTSAPTGVTVTVTSPDDRSFGFVTEWTHPSPMGSTVDYAVEVRYWLDAGLTTPDSDWIFLGGTWLDELQSGPFPRQTDGATRWVKVRVTPKNRFGQAGTPVESSAATVTAAPAIGETDFDGLKNPAFELGLQDWGVTGTVDSEATIVWEGLSARLPGDGSTNYPYQHVRAQPGAGVRFSAMARNSTNATCGACQITFKDKDYNSLGFVESSCAADSTFRRVEKVHTAPPNTAWLMVIPGYTTASHTSGYLYLDQCVLEIVTPIAGIGTGVTGATATAPTRVLTSGETEYQFSLGWTAQTITAERMSVRVYHRVGGVTTGLLGDYDVRQSSAKTDWWAAPKFAEAVTLRFHYVSQDEVESTSYTDVAVTVNAEAAQPIAGAAITNIPTAAFAAGIEPVTLVTATPNGSDELVISKTTNEVYNTTNQKVYVWDTAASRYKRSMTGADIKAQLTLDKLVAGQIAAGAITTSQLAANEILVGTGGDRPVKFSVVVSGATVVFMGYDSTSGYTGLWASQARFGGTISAPVVNINGASVSIAGASFTLNLNGITTSIDHLIDGSLYPGVKVKLNGVNTRSIMGAELFQLINSSNYVAAEMVTLPHGVARFRDSANNLIIELNAGTQVINLAGAGASYRIAGTHVVGPRRTGWGYLSGYTDRSGFDTATITTSQLAERVAALLQDLGLSGLYHGLISN
jgi:hypothetical protein